MQKELTSSKKRTILAGKVSKKQRAAAKFPISRSAGIKIYNSKIELVKRNLDGTEKCQAPAGLLPMLATVTKAPFNDIEWIFEIKWDGYRAIAYLVNDKVELRSRNNKMLNDTYPTLTDSLQEWGINVIVDGEVVVVNEEGKADFEALQNWQRSEKGQLVYYVFDILWLDGSDLRKLPLIQRKEILKKILPGSGLIKLSDAIEEFGTDFFEIARKNGLEGIVAKKKNSIYMPGRRTTDWLKLPVEQRQEFVIGGWTESEKPRSFRSLLFGYYEGNKLIYAGHSGGGFKEAEMPSILKKLKRLETKKSPFMNVVDTDSVIHYTRPRLVAEIKYASFTSAGKIRKPAIFLGFREDKDPQDVVKEIMMTADPEASSGGSIEKKIEENYDSNWPILDKQKITSKGVFNIGGKKLRLTNVENQLWKDVTKADLVKYYHEASPYILPHLKDRSESLHIKHKGPFSPGFYIKDMEGKNPGWTPLYSMIRKHKKRGKRERVDYLVCNDEATLLFMVNLGCIDVNPWTSRTSSPGSPDYIIIDLDPSGDDLSKLIETGKAAKQFFDEHKIKSLVKTSGKTGMHLYLPCTGFDFSQARVIAGNICEGIHRLVPSISTTFMSINQRGDNVYLDPNQNDFADTIAAPYSVRPHVLPCVSAPLEWKEVNANLDPYNFTMKSILKRIAKKGELFKDVLSLKLRMTNSKPLINFL